MKRNRQHPTLDNILKLFAKRIKDFRGESRRSYQKAFSSFQIFLISHYSLATLLEPNIVYNWIIDNAVNGLSSKTIAFYLDKISSLYSAVAYELEGGKMPLFKEIKKKLKTFSISPLFSQQIKHTSYKIKQLAIENEKQGKKNLLLDNISDLPYSPTESQKESIRFFWAIMALNAGINADDVKNIIKKVPPKLELIDLCEIKELNADERENIGIRVKQNIYGDPPQWFAMRLRPKVKYDDILQRFSKLNNKIKVPEIFYPYEEIVKRVGHKVVWENKPIIRDVIFFKEQKNKIYSLFCHIFDLAWCYKTPGGAPGDYAAIPSKAMEEFKNSLGILNSDFELAPNGEMELKPGDKVIIVDSNYMKEHAKVIKKPTFDEDGNKIYRVTLLNGNGHWDIGIDARLIKKE